MKLKALFLIILISFTSASKLSTQLQTKTSVGSSDLLGGSLMLGGKIFGTLTNFSFEPLVPLFIIFSPLILVGFLVAKLLGFLSDVFLTIIYSLGTIGSNDRKADKIMNTLKERRRKVKESINMGVFTTIAVPIGAVLSLPVLAVYGLYLALRAAFEFMYNYMSPRKLFYAIKGLFKSNKKELAECKADFDVDKVEFKEK